MLMEDFKTLFLQKKTKFYCIIYTICCKMLKQFSMAMKKCICNDFCMK